MKVILKQDVKNLGKKEDMVAVNDGYGRNYLIPRGIAVEINPSNLSVMKTKKEAELYKKDREMEHAKELARKLKDITLEIRSKAGENGKLFGSITGKDIADNLKERYNFDIDKRKIVLNDTIKSLGEYEAEIKLYTDVTATVAIRIVRDH